MINLLIKEVGELWTWILSVAAGLGVTVSLLIIVLILLSLKVTKISSKVKNLENRLISTERDFSLHFYKDKSSK